MLSILDFLTVSLIHNINGHPHLSGYPQDFKVDGNLEQHHSLAIQYSDIAICAEVDYMSNG